MQQTEEHVPVCGMEVDPSIAAASVEHEGATVYFCIQGCAAKIRVAPEKYAQAKPDADPSYPPAKTEPHAADTFRSEDGWFDLRAIRKHSDDTFCAACDILTG